MVIQIETDKNILVQNQNLNKSSGRKIPQKQYIISLWLQTNRPSKSEPVFIQFSILEMIHSQKQREKKVMHS